MIKKVKIEELKTQVKDFKSNDLLTKSEIKEALDLALKKTKINLEYFKDGFPTPATKDNVYPIMDNTEWTNGFWTGVLWLLYEYSNDEAILNIALKNVESFIYRIDHQIELDHHDLGFLYSPSCVANYIINKDKISLQGAIRAADKLIERYQSKGEFIQAWGELGKKDNYRLIIDCLLNIQLLFFVSKETGDQKYFEIGKKHFYTSVNNVIRDDASTFHTFYFDPETGLPLKGVTRQGYSDDSSWARGQAWGIYGCALSYRYLKDHQIFDLFKALTNYFLNRLPKDNVSYWDLIFSDGSGHSRDSSASAIAVCGMHEMLKYLDDSNEKELYKHACHTILKSLIENYANHDLTKGAPLLDHGVYSWHSGKGVDCGNIWGDYYYIEALMRFYKDWEVYW